jgi:hypothetical protein
MGLLLLRLSYHLTLPLVACHLSKKWWMIIEW